MDENKVILSNKLLSHAEDMRRKTLVLKVPKELILRRRRAGTVEHCDYLQKPDYKASNRRRTDPLVTLSTILDNMCLEMKEMEGTQLFWQPVNPKQVPDYYKIVTRPIDLQTMRKKVRDKLYACRQDFLDDLDQMLTNSVLYNGLNSVLTDTVRKMKLVAETKFKEKEDKFSRLEKAINPLLDDNDQVAFSYIVDKVVERLKAIPESWPFHKPVDKKKVKNYYESIACPMDLETLTKYVKLNKYSTRDEFLNDLQLIHSNSYSFNGADSQYTKKAEEMIADARLALNEKEQDESLTILEQSIMATKEAALDAVDSESVATGGEGGDHDEVFSRPPSSITGSQYMDFDESSQGVRGTPLDMSPEMDDVDAIDSDHSDLELDTPVPTRVPAPVPDEEQVAEDYDPEEFLLARFNQAPVTAEGSPEPPATLDFSSAFAQPSTSGHFAQPQVPGTHQGMYQIPPSVRQTDDDDDGGLWF